MFKFDFRFVRVRNKLTGFKLSLKTLNKTVQFEFSVASMPKWEVLPAGCYNRYTTLSNSGDVEC